MDTIGVVIIGRNEGKHLKECLIPLAGQKSPILYVDSASSDNSVAIARQSGVEVLQLDASCPMSPAIARNSGAKRILELNPHLQYIQFVDGDTVLEKNWLSEGQKIFKERNDVAIVSGDLKEKNDTSSIYKQVSSMEWMRHPGEIQHCGGNCMVRATIFRNVKGFNTDILSGEDTEFCLRIRRLRWKIFHTPQIMGVHNSHVDTFPTFWKRSMRTGYAYQQISQMYINDPEKLFVKENRSNWIFGGLIPLAALFLIPFTSGWSLLLLLAYPLLIVKIYLNINQQIPPKMAFLYSVHCAMMKIPGFIGALQFIFRKKPDYFSK